MQEYNQNADGVQCFKFKHTKLFLFIKSQVFPYCSELLSRKLFYLEWYLSLHRRRTGACFFLLHVSLSFVVDEHLFRCFIHLVVSDAVVYDFYQCLFCLVVQWNAGLFLCDGLGEVSKS